MEIYNIRNKCIICNGKYNHIYTIKNMPISFCPTNIDHSNDLFIDLIFNACQQCGSVQLENLIDPYILYKDAHNMTFETPMWKIHHNQFNIFINKELINDDSIIEVGGSSEVLANLILNKVNIKYKILDMCEYKGNNKKIEYRQGNCEDYNFDENDIVIMSHVFEHLYNPMKFIENLRKYNIKRIFISVPNLQKQINSNCLSVIHIEHTYLFDEIDTDWMFSQFNYQLKKREYFDNHSIFMEYNLNENQEPIKLLIRPERMYNIKEYFLNRENYLSNIIIPDNSFIVPSGHYGQMIYTYSKCKNNKILGFLDNDTSKQNLRTYGTPLYTYPLSEISKDVYKNKNMNIILHGGPYTNEIKHKLLEYNDIINIIII